MSRSQLFRLDPRTEATSVLLETTKELLKNDQIEDALPFLNEILVRLEGDTEKKARKTMAFTLYQLAHCQMKLGQYTEGGQHFIRFVEEFPEDTQMESARVLAAQCLTMQRQWPQVEEQAVRVLENPRLAADLKNSAIQLLAEARYQQEKWAEALRPLAFLFRTTKERTVRSGAAVMLMICHVRLNDFSALFHFLPRCDPAVRHDISLNAALLEAGDAHYNRGEFQKALLLYRLVFPRQELMAHCEKRLREIERSMKPFAAGGSQSLTQYKERQQKQQRLFDRLKKQHETLRGFQDYDIDVALRMAQCYNDLERNWPAYAVYRRIYEEHPGSELADQARFCAFSVMLDEREWALASIEGYEYLEKESSGQFLDDVTLSLMQAHMQQKQFESADEMGRYALELSPEHKYIDQVTYLRGSAHFQLLDYEDALTCFSQILVQWPKSRFREAAEYWHSMTLLFLGRFLEAEAAFKGYLSNPKYDPPGYAEDAFYRLGIAQYGAEKFTESEASFRAFVSQYPESMLLAEAYAMLGDMRAAEGELDIALDYYGTARKKARSISQVNYPLFQAAKVLELKKHYSEIVVLMDDYLDAWGGQGDYANAENWMGKAYKALGDYPHALGVYFEAADKYGNDAGENAIDIVLNELIKDYRGGQWPNFTAAIMERLGKHLKRANEQGRRTLQLRYQTVLAALTEGEEREAFIDAIVCSKNVPNAGPDTLKLIACEGVKRGEFELVHEVAERFMADFENSNNMLHVLLAEMDALIGEGHYDEAVQLGEDILLRFGYSKSVGYARKRRGDAFRLQGKYRKALEAYKEMLSVREWRGPLTPEVLYWSGMCKMKLGQITEAFAYFQRIYVLYENYTRWTASAYAKSILCMEALGGHEEEILNTCREMLANEAVAATAEGVKAAKRLEAEKSAGETW